MAATTTTDSQLLTFNSLALRCQDEAYTLAYYLLGDDQRAVEATQAAFARLYGKSSLRLDAFRREVLRRVLAHCKERRALFGRADTRDRLCRGLLALDSSQRSMAVLVDVLGLDYTEAASLLGCSTEKAAHLLAQARLNLSRQVL